MNTKSGYDKCHDQYVDNGGKWARARAVVAGGDEVKKGKTLFVPKLDSQTDAEYFAYINRGNFFNATSRTLDGLVGLVFRRKPEIIAPGGNGTGGKFNDFSLDVDMLGSNVDKYSRKIVTEVLAVGRAGTLIEWSDEETRAYLCRYDAEQILDWKMKRIAGKMRLSQVVLCEMAEPMDAAEEEQPTKPKNNSRPTPPRTSKQVTTRYGSADSSGGGVGNTGEDDADKVEQIRILSLEITPGETLSWKYKVELKQKMRNRAEYVTVQTIYPVRRGKFIDSIPFVFHGPKNSECDCDKLPLDDLIQTNLDHFKLDVDYKHGLHFTALPTAWVSGFPKESNLRIGSTTAWVTETPGAQAGFLEFKGQGLTSFVSALDRDEKNMAILGARLLEGQKKEAETAEAMTIRQAGEASALTNISESVGESMTLVLKWAYWWSSADEAVDKIDNKTISITLNKDFISARMQPDELTALVKSWQGQAISYETLAYNLKQGEILPPDVDVEQEIERIRTGHMPALPEPAPGKTKPAPGKGTKAK